MVSERHILHEKKTASAFRVRLELDHLYKETHNIYDEWSTPTANEVSLKDHAEQITKSFDNYLVVAELHNIVLVSITI